MKRRTIAVTGMLTVLLLVGYMRPVTAEASTMQTRASTSAKIDTVTKLEETTTYNSDLYITKSLNLNGQIMRVNGDLTIGAPVDLKKGLLIVSGNVLHTGGRVTFGKGTVQVSGDYRIQDRKVTVDGGYEYIDSEGTLLMNQGEDFLKVGGDLVIQSSRGNQNGYNYYTAGTIEVGGDFIQKNGNKSNFRASNSHKVSLTGTNPQVNIESGYAGFQHLEVASGVMRCGGNLRINQLDKNLTIQVPTGSELALAASLNGKRMTVQGDICLADGLHLQAGNLIVNGNVLHTGGRVSFQKGTLQTSGDYRIQDQKVTADGSYEYIDSEGTLFMDQGEDFLKVGGDLVIQSSRGNQNGYNYYTAGTIEVGGDFIQKNGNKSNFRASNSHKVILIGTRPQTVTMESEYAGFATLELTQPISNYTFQPNPCWKTLSTIQASIENCTVSPIAAQTYTGKKLKPRVSLSYQGENLVSGTDYTVSYSNNVKKGTAAVTIAGKGKYTGKKTLSFQINARAINTVYIAEIADKAYTGKAVKPSLTIRYGGKTLKKNKDYTLAYSNNKKIGKATVTVKGKGNYTGSVKKTFRIVSK